MSTRSPLTPLFTLVAVVEAVYSLAGIFIPPSLVATVPGWSLTPDGQWLAKLMGVALGSQALVAWSLRAAPPLPVAWALALYQLGSAVVDAAMWITFRDQGIFPIAAGRWSVALSIPTHGLIGLLLVLAILRTRPHPTPQPAR